MDRDHSGEGVGAGAAAWVPAGTAPGEGARSGAAARVPADAVPGDTAPADTALGDEAPRRYTFVHRICIDLRAMHIRARICIAPGPLRRWFLAGGRVTAAAANGVPAPAPFQRRKVRYRGNLVQSEPSGEKSSPGGALSQQSRPKEALRRQNLAGGLILAGGHAVVAGRCRSAFVAAPSSPRRRDRALALCSLARNHQLRGMLGVRDGLGEVAVGVVIRDDIVKVIHG